MLKGVETIGISTGLGSHQNAVVLEVIDSSKFNWFNWCFSFAPGFSKLFGAQGSPSSGRLLNLWSPCF